jgi:hypothetical protein
VAWPIIHQSSEWIGAHTAALVEEAGKSTPTAQHIVDRSGKPRTRSRCENAARAATLPALPQAAWRWNEAAPPVLVRIRGSHEVDRIEHHLGAVAGHRRARREAAEMNARSVFPSPSRPWAGSCGPWAIASSRRGYARASGTIEDSKKASPRAWRASPS